MKAKFYYRIGISALVLTTIGLIFDSLFHPNFYLEYNKFPWYLLSNFLSVLALGYYVYHSSLKRFRLVLVVFTIYFFIGFLNLSIEAFIFNVTDRSKTIEEIIKGFFVSLLFAPIFVYLLTQWLGQRNTIKRKSRSVLSWVWRMGVGVFLYVLFYLIAGMVLQSSYPELMEFYDNKLPSIRLMIGTQFPRGLLFVIIAITILRTSTLSNFRNALLIGFLFSILGAIAPLVPPSELMPVNIRFVHGIEVGISNFLYGVVLGYLLKQNKQEV